MGSRIFALKGGASGDGNAAAMRRSGRGVFIRAETGGPWQAGLTAGYDQWLMEVPERASTATVSGLHLAGYGGTAWNDLRLRLGAVFSQNRIGVDREVSFPRFAEVVRSAYEAQTAQLFGEVGYRLEMAGAAELEPFAELAYMSLLADGFEETGGHAALVGTGDPMALRCMTVGLRAQLGLPGMAAWTAHGALGWQQSFGEHVPTATISFSDGAAYTVSGSPVAAGALLVEAGVEVDLTDVLILGVGYSGRFHERGGDTGVVVSARWRL